MIPFLLPQLKNGSILATKKTLQNANCLSLSCYSLLLTCQEKHKGDLVLTNYFDMYKCGEL